LQFKVDIDYFKSFNNGNPKDYILMNLRKTTVNKNVKLAEQ